MGLAERGKTPLAQAIGMASSEYHILVQPKEAELNKPSFRTCASLDQLRGGSGMLERPDLLDDADPATLPVSKLKSLLDSTLAEVRTVERWTTSRFVRHQLRIVCDNKVEESAETPKGSGLHVPLKHFLDMIKPAFHKKASKQDIMACLKRSLDSESTPRGVCSSCRYLCR